MYYKCDGFSYGYECNLMCMGNLNIDGNDTIVCEKNPKSNRAEWDTGHKEPICNSKTNLFFYSHSISLQFNNILEKYGLTIFIFAILIHFIVACGFLNRKSLQAPI